MHIGILQTGHAPEQIIPERGDIDAMFRTLLAGHGFEFTTYPVVDGVFPTGAEAADGWLITGSKHGVYEDHAWLAPLEALIRQILGANRPLIGVCFGHQVIAQALGGRVAKFDGGWTIGRQIYDFNGEKLSMNAWHQDQVLELPPGAVCLAQSATCRYAAYAIGHQVLSFQAHPEFGNEMVAALLKYRSATVPEALRDAAAAQLDAPTDRAVVAARMAAHFLAARNTGDTPVEQRHVG